MATFWFIILVVLVVAYAILDGFDLGVGVLHLAVARTDAERRTALSAIGPVWDANEVWLLGFGVGAFLAFPRTFAVGFSGFYLPLMIVLWLLMGRGIALEFRHHILMASAATGLIAMSAAWQPGHETILGADLDERTWTWVTPQDAAAYLGTPHVRPAVDRVMRYP